MLKLELLVLILYCQHLLKCNVRGLSNIFTNNISFVHSAFILLQKIVGVLPPNEYTLLAFQ